MALTPTHLIEGPADPVLLDEVRQWRRDLAPRQFTRTARLPLDEVPGWRTSPDLSEYCHESGRFFAIRGVSTRTPGGDRTWMQPMVDQPEIGLLAIAVTPTSRGFAALIQAKAEPGNVNGIQLSPTVQATRSNQLRVHGGRAVPYLELFDASPADAIVDSRQSEHGGVFWQKRNRVMIVRTPPFEPRPGFRWIEIADLMALLHDDDLVHADARAVLACAPWSLPADLTGAGPLPAIALSLDEGIAAASVRPLARWLSAQRMIRTLETRRVPLPDLAGWHRTREALIRSDGTGYEVVAMHVVASGREVDGWCQPMVRPVGVGLIGLAVAHRGEQLEVLMQARPEPGLVDGVELGPTVQVAGGDAPQTRAEADLMAHLLDRPEAEVFFDAVLSDEGGRFLHSRNRHLVVGIDAGEAPDGYRWCRLGELVSLLIHSHQVNMQARSALLCLLAASTGGGRHLARPTSAEGADGYPE